MKVFIIGGCRSGKSAHALAKAVDFKADRRLFVATCQPYDEEMRTRIARHQRERDPGWETREVPLELSEALRAHNASDNIILVDCLTLWITNLMMDGRPEAVIEGQVEELTLTLADMHCPVILVANEVGQGIVPENQMARQFRDWAGLVNQKVAACVDRVIWMVAGIPVEIK